MAGEILQVGDYATQARLRLPSHVWDYVEGGSGAELTIAANRAAFDGSASRPGILVDVSDLDTSTTLLGSALPSPVGIAPTAYQALIHPGRETDMVAGAAGHLAVISFFATRTIEEIAAPRPARCGCSCTGCDAPPSTRRHRQRAPRPPDTGRWCSPWTRPRSASAGATPVTDSPSRTTMRAVNLDPGSPTRYTQSQAGTSALAVHADQAFDTTITWADLAWLRGLTVAAAGAQGHPHRATTRGWRSSTASTAIIVSNHGGRQVDGAVAALRRAAGRRGGGGRPRCRSWSTAAYAAAGTCSSRSRSAPTRCCSAVRRCGRSRPAAPTRSAS